MSWVYSCYISRSQLSNTNSIRSNTLILLNHSKNYTVMKNIWVALNWFCVVLLILKSISQNGYISLAGAYDYVYTCYLFRILISIGAQSSLSIFAKKYLRAAEILILLYSLLWRQFWSKDTRDDWVLHIVLRDF